MIIDLVSTGRTLKENNLVPIAEIGGMTARLVANRVSYRLKYERLAAIVASIKQALEGSPK